MPHGWMPRRCTANRALQLGNLCLTRSSKLNQRGHNQIENWLNRTIEGEHPYAYRDGIVLKRSWAGEVCCVSVLVAIGVGALPNGQSV